MIVRTDRGEYDVDYVLGADGANSIVRKKLARPFARAELSVAAGFFVHGATASSIAVKTTCDQPGTCGRFPGPIIWRSASVPRPPTTPRQASCARSRRHGSSSTTSIGARG